MDKILEEYIKNRPQRLCHMCGKCCRCATSSRTYEEIKEIAETGDEGAIDFLRIFEPYPIIEDAKKDFPDVVDNIINALSSGFSYGIEKLTLYKCRYISDNNQCTIYNNRPELCELTPGTPFSVMPPGCGFEGWLFQKREERKAQIRKSKEELLSLEALLKDIQNEEQINKVQSTIENIKKTIEMYSKYGAKDW